MEGNVLLDQFDFFSMEQAINQLLGGESIRFVDLIKQLMTGESVIGLDFFSKLISQVILGGVLECKNLFLMLFIIGVLSALLNNVTNLFEKKQGVDLAKYLIYLMISIVLFKGFLYAFSICRNTILSMVDFMRILLPAYCLSIGFAKGSLSAYGYYQFMLLLIFAIQNIMLIILLPLSKAYIFLAFMNGISKEGRFKGVLSLIDKGITYSLKGFIYMTIGSGTIQMTVAPAVDKLNKTLVQKTICIIPGIGDITDSVADVLVSSASVIKSSLSVAGLIVVIILCVGPLVKLLLFAIVVRLASAIIELLGEKKLVDYLNRVSKGNLFLFQTSLCTGVLLFIAIALSVR